MRSRSKLKMGSDDEQVATNSKKGKRSRQTIDDGSDSDHAPPAKRRTPSATKTRPEHTNSEPEQDDEEVDIEGTDSPPRPIPHNDDDDVVDTSSSRLSSPDPSPAHKQSAPKPERASRSKPNRIESDDEDPKPTSPTPASKPPRAPIRQDSATRPLRKPVGAGSRAKEKEKEALSTIPAIPRRPKDTLAVKDTQDMDLLNKDVYNQLFNTSSSSKPIAKSAQTEAKQKEINAKRQAAKSALLKARESTFDLQLPTDKVLAFESRLRKLHRWYAPSALGFTYHEELRQRQRLQAAQAQP